MDSLKVRALAIAVVGAGCIVMGLVYHGTAFLLLIPGVLLVIAGILSAFFIGGRNIKKDAGEKGQQEEGDQGEAGV